VDLTPEHIYRSCAEASWEAPGTQRLWNGYQRDIYIKLMIERPDWRAVVDSAYRAGQEDAARQPAEPVKEGERLTADRVRGLLNSAERGIWLAPPPWTGGYHEHVAKWLEQVAEQIVTGLEATPEQQGALSLAQAYLTWRADQVDQPRTPSGCDGEDNPEERTDG
jgi:hypothetical protein